MPETDLAFFQNVSDQRADWTAGEQRESEWNPGFDRVTRLGPFQKARNADEEANLNVLMQYVLRALTRDAGGLGDLEMSTRGAGKPLD